MNITLSANEEIVRKVREYAKRHNSSLNRLVRGYLEQLVAQMDSESAADEFAQMCESYAGKSPDGYKFRRDDVYDRRGRS